MRPLERALGALEVARGPDPRGEYLAFCPAHDDRHTPNLHVREAEDGGVLLHCFAGCDQDEVLSALEEKGIRKRDLFARENGVRGREVHLHPEPHATLQQGCSLETYAQAKGLPVGFLTRLGLSDFRYAGSPAVRVPYRDTEGVEVAVRFRLALEKGPEGDDRFRWRRGDKARSPMASGA